MLYYALDTETTVAKDEDLMPDEWDNLILEGETKVWSVAFTPLSASPEEGDVIIKPDLTSFIWWCECLEEDATFYVHNLKYDGTFFIFYFLLTGWKFKNCSIPRLLRPREFLCLRTERGVYHNIKFRTTSGRLITLLDSLKIAPFSLEKLGNDYNTKYKKLTMEYTGKQSLEGLSESDLQYIKNDVLCLAEVVYRLREAGVNKNTTSSTALAYYKETLKEEYFKNPHTETKEEIKSYCKSQGCNIEDYAYRKLFPHLKSCLVPECYANSYYKEVSRLSGVPFNQTMFAFQAYFGGWCYVNPKYKGKRLRGRQGESWDATSHYPSMMHSVTNHLYPTGEGEIRAIDVSTGEPVNFDRGHEVYIIQLECEFKLKKGFFPSIQIKGDPRYHGREWLESSNGLTVLTLAQPHYEGLRKRYDLFNFRGLVAVVYKAQKGMFDAFIDHWIEEKEAHRELINGVPNPNFNFCVCQLSKNNLNGLYGKFCSKPATYEMIPRLTTAYKLDATGSLPHDSEGNAIREPVGVKLTFTRGALVWNDDMEQYSPVGVFCTAYARETTIGLAEANFDFFLYSDTDSCKFLQGGVPFPVSMRGGKLGLWKKEGEFRDSLFLRPKTYIYSICEKYNESHKEYELVVTCAGLTKLGKKKLLALDCQVLDRDGKEVKINSHDPFDYFREGLYIKGCKLASRQIMGGTRLIDSDFSIQYRQ